jgi:hypothetical protein
MKMLLEGMAQRIGKWQIVLVCGILTIGFMLFLGAADRQAPLGTPGIVQLEVAFSEDNFRDIVERWSEVGTLQVQRRNLWIDLLFPFAYASFLSSLLAWLAIRPSQEPNTSLVRLLILPFIAGLFDWVENFSLLFLLRDSCGYSQPLIFFSSTVASMKWVLILVSVLAIVYHIVRRVIELIR